MKALKDIDWEQVLALDAFSISNVNGPRLRTALSWLKRAWFTKLYIPTDRESDYLFFRSLNRDDYKKLFESVAGTVDSSKTMIQDFSSTSKAPSPLYVLVFLLYWSVFAKIKAPSFKYKVYLYLKACPYITVLRKIRKNRFKKLVLFADMQAMDNLLAQYFDDRITVTLQHGLYVDYGNSNTINTVNYQNQPSRYFLAWGRDTANLIQRYHPERKVRICGKPNLDESPKIESPESARYFSVIFDQNMFQEYNVKLLDLAYQVADKTGLKVNLRLHPWNNPEWYDIRSNDILMDRPLVCSEFVIGHTTSMIYEMLRIGVPAFKLKTKECALQTPESLQFESVEDLIALQQRGLGKDEIKKIGMNYIESCGQASLRQYRKFFTELAAPSH